MKEAKRILVLEPDEYRMLLHGLIYFRNTLIAEGRHTDAVNDLIIKLDKSTSHKKLFA